MAKVQNIDTVITNIADFIDETDTIKEKNKPMLFNELARLMDEGDEAGIRAMAHQLGVVDSYTTEAPIAEHKETMKIKKEATKVASTQRKDNIAETEEALRAKALGILLKEFDARCIMTIKGNLTNFGKAKLEETVDGLKVQMKQRADNMGAGEGWTPCIEENNKSKAEKKEEAIKSHSVSNPKVGTRRPRLSEFEGKDVLLVLDDIDPAYTTAEYAGTDCYGWKYLNWDIVAVVDEKGHKTYLDRRGCVDTAVYEFEPDPEFVPEVDEDGKERPDNHKTCSNGSIAQRIYGWYFSDSDGKTKGRRHREGDEIDGCFNDIELDPTDAINAFELLKKTKTEVRATIARSEFDGKLKAYFRQIKADNKGDKQPVTAATIRKTVTKFTSKAGTKDTKVYDSAVENFVVNKLMSEAK